MTSPSQYKKRQEYMHVSVRKDPYGNMVREWARNKGITMTEMCERMVTTYDAMNGAVTGETSALFEVLESEIVEGDRVITKMKLLRR